MLKELIRKIVLRLWPEMAAGLHLPIWAIVTAVPDPPTGGEVSDEFTPKYAVDIRLLKPDLSIDEDMPLMRDVPVAMTASAPDRGFAALPQPGTIVELAFAFGHQTRPYIRSVIPLTRKLPMIDALSMRWQQAADSFQEVDAKGNWSRKTNGTITDTSAKEYDLTAPMIYIGNEKNNLLKLCSDHLVRLISALETMATHTHPHPLGTTSPPSEAEIFNQLKIAATEIKTSLDAFTK